MVPPTPCHAMGWEATLHAAAGAILTSPCLPATRREKFLAWKAQAKYGSRVEQEEEGS